MCQTPMLFIVSNIEELNLIEQQWIPYNNYYCELGRFTY